MKNPRPTVARLVGGPLARRSVRVAPGQAELELVSRGRRLRYRIDWPPPAEPAVCVLEVRAVYAGELRRR